MKGDPSFWVEDTEEDVFVPLKAKRKHKVKKLEFIGWGSRPLLEFLGSIGIDTSKQLTQKEVSSLIIQYVNSNNLLHPQKKKRVLCDDRLRALFGKKFIPRLKIYDLLEVHFTENHDESEDEPYSSEEEDDDDVRVSYKEKKATSSARKLSLEKKNVQEAPNSCFAAVIPENIKLVYLKRSVVMELLKIPESSEEKIKFSYVRVKSDPNDYLQKHAYQLQQVTGIRKTSGAVNDSAEIQLQVTNSIIDIPLRRLSDDNFSEEECEDLRERVKAGLIEKPTIVELDAKAKLLHEDIMKHWIAREIKLLQTRIDRANEKGWRRELFEYMERMQLLQTKSEQTRLLSEVPKVIAEELELQPKPMDTPIEAEVVNSSSPSDTCKAVAAGVLDAHETPNQVEENGVLDAHGTPKQVEEIGVRDAHETAKQVEEIGVLDVHEIPKQVEEIGVLDAHETVKQVEEIGARDAHETAKQVEGIGVLDAHEIPKQVEEMVKFETEEDGSVRQDKELLDVCIYEDKREERKDENSRKRGYSQLMPERQVVASQVIELSDDDDEEDEEEAKKQEKRVRNTTDGEDLRDSMWYYLDPQGEIQGPFSILSLRIWRDKNYFSADFMVWKAGLNKEQAILLTDVIRRVFPDG